MHYFNRIYKNNKINYKIVYKYYSSHFKAF
jgi:hypothetical protein